MASSWNLTISDRARDDLNRIPQDDRHAVYRGIYELAQDAPNLDCKKLRGFSNRWRLRVGDWRVIFVKDKAERSILVVRVRNRKDAY